MSRSLRFRLTSLGTVAWVWIGVPTTAKANPQGGVVVAGSATISPAATTVAINQASQNAIINWQSFNVRTGEAVVFNQPNAQASTLNRVVGNEGASLIDGNITANGRVFIINPDGIVFGKGAVVNVGGLVATTHNVADADFIAGNYAFAAGPNPTASVVNLGQITAAQGGFAALVAPAVRNSGIIAARLGTIALASGNAFTLDFYGDRLINLEVSGTIASQVVDAATGKPVSSLVANTGTVSADGGTVILTASTAKTVVDDVINTSGVIEATSVGQSPGTITLSAPTASTKSAGAPIQSVAVSGTLDVSGQGRNETGGAIAITGENVALTGATLNASGSAGGGAVLIGGDFGGGNPNAPAVIRFGQTLQPQLIGNATGVIADAATMINASATSSGNGGKVAVWSAGTTTYGGSILANGGSTAGIGGFVETSGKSLSINGAQVSVGSAKGKAGTWLLDPADYVIDSTAASTIEASLATGNVAVTTDASGTGGNGDIVLNSSLAWQANTTLLLDAYHSVQLNDNITASANTAGLSVVTNDGGSGGYFLIAPGASVNLTGSGPALNINNLPYTLLRTATDVSNFLSTITASSSGNYAIANDIDLSGLNYAYNSNVYLAGNLNGLGHTLNGFSQQGLAFIDIVGITGSISNIYFLNASISSIDSKNFFLDPTSPNAGANSTLSIGSGLLAGTNFGSIYNAYVSGTIVSIPVDGSEIGGLVGFNFGKIFNTSANANITTGINSEDIGGLVGYNGSGIDTAKFNQNDDYTTGNIYTSYSSGSIRTPDNFGFQAGAIGGLVGDNISIDNSINKYISLVENSYSTVNIVINSRAITENTHYTNIPSGIGGLIGSGWDGVFMPGQATVINSYSAGTITANANSIGGLVGGAASDGDVSNSFSVSAIAAGQNSAGVGGLIGSVAGTGAFSLGPSEGSPTQAAATASWDFTKVWAVGSGGQPVLRAFQTVIPGAAPAPAPPSDNGGSSGTGGGSGNPGDGGTGAGGTTGSGSGGSSGGGGTTPADIQQFLSGAGYGSEGLSTFNLYTDPLAPLNVNDQGQILESNWSVYAPPATTDSGDYLSISAFDVMTENNNEIGKAWSDFGTDVTQIFSDKMSDTLPRETSREMNIMMHSAQCPDPTTCQSDDLRQLLIKVFAAGNYTRKITFSFGYAGAKTVFYVVKGTMEIIIISNMNN